MRVVVISHGYPSSVDPTAGIFIHQHVAALRRAGAEVQVLSPVPWAPGPLRAHARWGRYAALAEAAPLPDGPFERPAYLHAPTALGNAAAGFALAARLLPLLRARRRSFPFDVLHAHTLTPDGLAAWLCARALNVPVVVSIRGSDLHVVAEHAGARLALTRRVLLGADAVTAVSAELAREARRVAGRDVDVRVVYNGVDTDRFRPCTDRAALRDALGLPRGAVLALFVGRVEPEKGVDELFGAFERAAPGVPDLHLVLVGAGPSLDGGLARLARAGLSQRVHAPGRLAHAQVAAMMQACDLLVLPSWAEGMPNVMLEAMACGLPPIVTPVGGVPEVIVDGANGCLVPPRAPDALAAALSALATSVERRERLGRAALAAILERFSWERNARETLAVYARVARRSA